MLLIRRTFLQVAASAIGLFAAPAFVRTESLMPLRGARYWVKYEAIKPVWSDMGLIGGGCCPQNEFLKVAKEYGAEAFDYSLIVPPASGMSLDDYTTAHAIDFPKAQGFAFGGPRRVSEARRDFAAQPGCDAMPGCGDMGDYRPRDASFYIARFRSPQRHGRLHEPSTEDAACA